MTAGSFDGCAQPTGPIRIGISACLLGQKVRYDGGHKRDAFLTDELGRFVEWVSVCPEVEAGFGTPREAMHLRRSTGSLRLVTVKTDRDVTASMERFVQRRMPALVAAELSGYILKKSSPSCGLARVKVYDASGALTPTTGRGLFADALLSQLPLLPVEEEGRLNDPRLRENFIERVFAYSRLRTHFRGRWSAGSLVRFHTAHKLILMSHSPLAYRRLGRLVATPRQFSRVDLQRRYSEGFMDAMTVMATTRRHTNVLQHIAGYFKKELDAASKAELQTTIEDYRRGLVPLIVPMTLIRHHVRVHHVDYLAGQLYLEPHPKELMLRNHA